MILDMLMVVLGVLSLVLAFPVPVIRWERIPLLGWQQTPMLVWILVVIATVLPALVAWRLQKRVLRKLEADPEHPGDAHYRYIHSLQFTQWGLGLAHGAILTATNWQNVTRDLPVVGHWVLVPSTIAVIPFLTAVVLVWIAFYPAERAIKQVSLEVHLMRGKPVRPLADVWAYVINNLRHQVLFIMIPMLMIILARDLVQQNARAIKRFAHGYDSITDVLIGSAALLIALITPEILRHVWLTQRLPVGALRDRLQILSKQIGVRCREILVWKAGGGIVNAAVMGVVAPLRYVLITEAMLEELDDRRIEAVYGHEVGHVKRWHIIYLLLFAAISGSLVTIFSVRSQAGMSDQTYQITATILGGILFAKWSLLFGWISRRFERQADIYGVRTLMLTGLECHSSCRIHGEPNSQPAVPVSLKPREMLAKNAPLCKTAAEFYGATLNKVAILNGIPPEANSWRHGSIADRGRTVEALASDPAALAKFETGVMRLKIILAVCSLAVLTWAAIELKAWELLGVFFGGFTGGSS